MTYREKLDDLHDIYVERMKEYLAVLSEQKSTINGNLPPSAEMVELFDRSHKAFMLALKEHQELLNYLIKNDILFSSVYQEA